MDKYSNWGITILRVVVAVVFIMHGGQKFFVQGLGAVAGAFGHMGIPLAPVAAAVAATVELVGGILLLLGLYSRWAAVLLAVDMAVAVFKVHLPNGFFLPRGFEYAFTLLGASLALALAGPGAAALERRKRRR